MVNSNTANAQVDVWLREGYSPDEANAMLHTYWFALNSRAGNTLELSDEDLRDLGIAHETDWRNSYFDSARDILNNETGIELGKSANSPEEVLKAVEDAFNRGDLYCTDTRNAKVVACSGR